MFSNILLDRDAGTRPFPVTKAVYTNGSGSDITLYPGYAFCFDHDNSTAANQECVIEKPTFANITYPAGVLSAPAPVLVKNGERVALSICPIFCMKDFPGVEVWTDQSITAGDLLGPQPGSWSLRKGALFGAPWLRANQTVDRSSTAGTVRGTFAPLVDRFELLQFQHEMFEDWVNYTDEHEGWDISLGASATAAATLSVLTLTTTNVDDIQAIIFSKVAQFAPAVGKPAMFEWLCTPTEAGSNAGNFFCGLHDGSVSATIPVSASNALTATNESFAIFHKLATASVWSVSTNDDGATATATATSAATGSGTAKRFTGLWDGVASWLFAIDKTLVATHTTDLPTGKNLRMVAGALASTTEIEILASAHAALRVVK